MQLAYSTLYDEMDMDPKFAEKAKAEVGRTIMNKLEVARNENPSIWTVFMVIHVDCTIEISDESSGEHGYDQLLERLGSDDGSICCEEFESTDHILVTTCKHTFHYSCLFEWLSHLPRSCPLCRTNLSLIFGCTIKF
uniref:RING-type domain-containing protein n=1 Tax=Nymphaea colorata TaxID=210225 RepID=A0A5K1A2Y6_9MAGN